VTAYSLLDLSPVNQGSTARDALHRSRALELVESGKAYRCYRTRDELETLRANHEQALRWEVLRLPEDEHARREAAGEPHVVRMRMPPGSIRFTASCTLFWELIWRSPQL